MGFYGVWETWRVVYVPKVMNGGIRGVAFVQAGDQGHAMQTFRQLYGGQYSAVESIKKLSECK